MSVKVNSRNTLCEAINLIDPMTGRKVAPTYLDLRYRVTERSLDDKLVEVRGTHSWPGLAAALLEDPTAWWVIADISDVVDPFAELAVGAKLRVPSQHRYYFNILGE